MAAVLQISTLFFLVILAVFAHADQEPAMAVQGIVYCQRCSAVGTSSLLNARPLLSAKVAITCRDYKNRVRVYLVAPVDFTGYFYTQLDGNDMTSDGIGNPEESCKVQLVSSGDMTCNRLTNVNKGITGTDIKFEKTLEKGTSFEINLYTASSLAFSPSHCIPGIPHQFSFF
ncbi:hypothetical protein ZOSMA_114G00880 [Zostera marina]|uniref:Pollen Ole e 1 allergen and extensin family protein n=1 Tax=Zostera marina TaxID=29655 RepID=A0A0K9Q2F6_ZOSMR|nr:hypothetical protein ZOSMA_114G00880 [Zostera marina]